MAEVLFLSVFCTAIAFIVQTTVQQHTTAVHTSLIFSLEPLFALVFAYIYYNEVLELKEYIGAGVLFCGTLFAELDIPKFVKNKFYYSSISRKDASTTGKIMLGDIKE